MKLIQQCKLFFREGNSDKVYEIDLCQLTNGEYIVNFRYGRRGAALKEGTKTPASVALEEAEKIFQKLELEKRSKGYQTEQEVNLPLPSLNTIDKKTSKGAILLRLHDALEGNNSFKTSWKTSRVIWKAGQLNITEAIPYIVKLATKGDAFQLHAAIVALINLQAHESIPFLTTMALQIKQKEAIRWMAFEGLFQLMEEGEAKEKIKTQCFSFLPETIQSLIKEGETQAAFHYYDWQLEENLPLEGFNAFYLLVKFNPQWQNGITKLLEKLPLKPPYFKVLRSVYKLAQIRKDNPTLALLSYRFEKEDPMFNRTASLDIDGYPTHQYIDSLGKYINIGKQLKNKDSKIAFSQYTKYYLQKNAANFLTECGKNQSAKNYLNLAIAHLLQYQEEDYTQSYTQEPNPYGMYRYGFKQYFFTSTVYAECTKAFLLSNILFGNDISRMVTPKLELIHEKIYYVSNNWIYKENEVRRYDPLDPASKSAPKKEKGLLDTIKRFFSKKEVEISPAPITTPEVITNANQQRKELYPEHWDAHPEAYVQLLMKAQMALIHEFAWKGLQAHPSYESIKQRFSTEDIIALLSNSFQIPQDFGFQLLQNRKEDFEKNPELIQALLNISHKPTLDWTTLVLQKNPSFYLNHPSTIVSLIFNTQNTIDLWIDSQLTALSLNETQKKEIVEQCIEKLMVLKDTPENNSLAKKATSRLKKVAADQLIALNSSVISYLLSSPLRMNTLLVSEIIALKVEAQEKIPVSLYVDFIKNSIPEVQQIGLDLLQKTSDSEIQNHWNTLLELLQHNNPKIVENILTLGIRSNMASQLQSTWIQIIQTLISKPAFEDSHSFIINLLPPYKSHLKDLEPNYLIQALFANYRNVQVTAASWLYDYPRIEEFTLRQIIALAESELLTVRQWAWHYYENHLERIKKEKEKALTIVDAKWDDTRQFAFQFFRNHFAASDWTTETLISLVDAVREDVMQFGKELIMRYFSDTEGHQYLIKLSQHPSEVIQLYVSNLLKEYAANAPERLASLDFYFRSVLFRVHKGRITKERVFDFLTAEALKNEAAARYVNQLYSYLSATTALQDKSRLIEALSQIQDHYPQLDSCLILNS